MTMSKGRWPVLVAVLGGLLAMACVDIGGDTAPSRFYVLSAAEGTNSPQSSDGPAILVGPLTLPRYLDRPQIVTRPTPNQLSLAEYDRWGGRLDDNVVRVLAQDLAAQLGTDRVAIFPREQRLPDALQVSVDVSRFEQIGAQSEVELDAQWSLYPPDRREPPVIGTSRIRVAPKGNGVEATVAAMSEALNKLAQEIADAARKRLPGGAAAR
jgi:uncharacterized lipoprotein YmbA